ncbi:MAG TPA: hypothetical protein VGR21_01595, partial [Cryptosporangiaceae bacterium]|nr:hypothetical protein [Cryptosporangiaceae bacterium]
ITVAHDATDAAIERGLVHEFAEIAAVRAGHENNQGAMLRAGVPVAREWGDVTAQFVGRLAELAHVVSAGDAAETAALAVHMGLLEGVPGAAELRALVEERHPGLVGEVDQLIAREIERHLAAAEEFESTVRHQGVDVEQVAAGLRAEAAAQWLAAQILLVAAQAERAGGEAAHATQRASRRGRRVTRHRRDQSWEQVTRPARNELTRADQAEIRASLSETRQRELDAEAQREREAADRARQEHERVIQDQQRDADGQPLTADAVTRRRQANERLVSQAQAERQRAEVLTTAAPESAAPPAPPSQPEMAALPRYQGLFWNRFLQREQSPATAEGVLFDPGAALHADIQTVQAEALAARAAQRLSQARQASDWAAWIRSEGLVLADHLEAVRARLERARALTEPAERSRELSTVIGEALKRVHDLEKRASGHATQARRLMEREADPALAEPASLAAIVGVWMYEHLDELVPGANELSDPAELAAAITQAETKLNRAQVQQLELLARQLQDQAWQITERAGWANVQGQVLKEQIRALRDQLKQERSQARRGESGEDTSTWIDEALELVRGLQQRVAGYPAEARRVIVEDVNPAVEEAVRFAEVASLLDSVPEPADIERRHADARATVEAARALAVSSRTANGEVDPRVLARFIQDVPRVALTGTIDLSDPGDVAVVAEFAAAGLGVGQVSLTPLRFGGEAPFYLVREVRPDGDEGAVALLRLGDFVAGVVTALSAMERLSAPEFTQFSVPEPVNVRLLEMSGRVGGALLMTMPPGQSLDRMVSELPGRSDPARPAAFERLLRAVESTAGALAELHTRPAGSGRTLRTQNAEDLAEQVQEQLDAAGRNRRVLEAAGLDVDALTERLREAVDPAQGVPGGVGLISGNPTVETIFSHPEHGVTFVAVGPTHTSMDADGAPIGAAGDDVNGLRASVQAVALGEQFSVQEALALATALDNTYRDAGGSPRAVAVSAGIGELGLANYMAQFLASPLASVLDRDGRELLEGRLQILVGVLRNALDLPTTGGPDATPRDGGSVTASAVAGSVVFGGEVVRPGGPDAAAVLTEAARVIAANAERFGAGVVTDADGGRRVRLAVGGDAVPLVSGRLAPVVETVVDPDGTVRRVSRRVYVQTQYGPDGRPTRITVAHDATDAAIERGLVHEFAEIAAVAAGHENNQGAMLRAGVPVAREWGDVTAQFVGRLAELAHVVAAGDAVETAVLAAHMGLLAGVPGAAELRALVEERHPGLVGDTDRLATGGPITSRATAQANIEIARALAVASRSAHGEVDDAAVNRFVGAMPFLGLRFDEDFDDLPALAEFAGAHLDTNVSVERHPTHPSVYLAKDVTTGTVVAVVKVFDYVEEVIEELSALDRLSAGEFTTFTVPEPKNVAIVQTFDVIGGVLVMSVARGRPLEDVMKEVAGLSGAERAAAFEVLRAGLADAVAALAELHTRPERSGRDLAHQPERIFDAERQEEELDEETALRSDVERALRRRGMFEAAGVDLDALVRFVDQAAGAAGRQRGGAALVHGDADLRNIFWHPAGDRRVTFIDNRQLHHFLDVEGAPVGSAWDDLSDLWNSVINVARTSGFSNEEILALRSTVIETYRAAGGPAEALAAFHALGERAVTTLTMHTDLQTLNELLDDLETAEGQDLQRIIREIEARARAFQAALDLPATAGSPTSDLAVDPATVPALDELIPYDDKRDTLDVPRIRSAIVSQFSGRTYAGMSVHASGAQEPVSDTDLLSRLNRNRVPVTLGIAHPERGQVGEITLEFARHNEDGSLFADIVEVRLDPRVQGSGFLSAFVRHLEKWTSQSGLDHITVEGSTESAAAYALAQLGFDWKPGTEDYATEILDSLAAEKAAVDEEATALRRWLDGDRDVDVDGLLTRHEASDPRSLLAELERQSAEAAETLDRAMANPLPSVEFPTPLEISRAGWNGQRGPDVSWVGKRAMMGATSGWFGVKWLPGPSVREVPASSLRAGWPRTALPASRLYGPDTRPDGIDPIATFEVPESATFHGRGRPGGPDAAGVVETARQVVAGGANMGVRVVPPAEVPAGIDLADGFAVEIALGPTSVIVPVVAGPLADRAVARTEVDENLLASRITLSDQAADGVIERALVQVFAQIRALQEGHALGKGALRAGAVAGQIGLADLTAPFVGRIAELAYVVTNRDAVEAAALARNMGIRPGMPGAADLRAVIEGQLPGLITQMDQLVEIADFRLEVAPLAGSAFHGQGRPQADPAAVLRQVGRLDDAGWLAEAADLVRLTAGPASIVRPTGETLDLVSLGSQTLDNASTNLWVRSGPLDDGLVAVIERDPIGDMMITVSDRASDEVIPRALADAIVRGLASVDGSPEPGGFLRADGPEPSPDAVLSVRDRAELAQLRVLVSQFAQRTEWGLRAVPGELRAFVAHLGLGRGTPGAQARRELIGDPALLDAVDRIAALPETTGQMSDPAEAERERALEAAV